MRILTDDVISPYLDDDPFWIKNSPKLFLLRPMVHEQEVRVCFRPPGLDGAWVW
jgi:hypothetical protein